MLLERRRLLHAQIVHAIETLYQDRLAEQVERLAHHAQRGELWDRAVIHCHQAAQRAGERGANPEAITYLESALVALNHMPETDATVRQAIDLRIALRNFLYLVGEIDRSLTLLREAETRASTLGDNTCAARVAGMIAHHFWVKGENARAAETGEHAGRLAATLDDVGLQVGVASFVAEARHARGDYPEAIRILRSGVELLQGDLESYRFGATTLTSVVVRTFLIFSLSQVGEFDDALSLSREALRIAEGARGTLPYRSSLLHAYLGLGTTQLVRGEIDASIAALSRAREISEEGNLPFFTPWIASQFGYAHALGGRTANGLALMKEGLERGRSMKVLVSEPLWLTYLGEGYLRAGQVEDARVAGQRALTLARQRSERGHVAQALRLLGQSAWCGEGIAEGSAQEFYREALTLAVELGMRPLVAHCHLGLGKLYRHTGDAAKAEEHLTTARTMYREMDMGFYLAQAEAAGAGGEP